MRTLVKYSYCLLEALLIFQSFYSGGAFADCHPFDPVISNEVLTLNHAVSDKLNLETEGGYLSESHEPHDVALLNNGVSDLKKRIDLIRSCKGEIDYEAYLFRAEGDDVGRTLLRELVQKRASGTRVKILVDGFGDNGVKGGTYFSPSLIEVLKKHGIEISVYNPGGWLPFWKHLHHDHRKTLSCDGKEAIVGGRNSADEYFGNSQAYNYQDRDVWVSGPIVGRVKDSFDRYWNSKWTKPVKEGKLNLRFFDLIPSLEIKKRQEEGLKKAEDFIAVRPDPVKSAEYIRFLNHFSEASKIAPPLRIHHLDPRTDFVRFATDSPEHGKGEVRAVSRLLAQEIGSANESVTFENYNIASKEKAALIDKAHQNGAVILGLTNGSESNDGPDLTVMSHENEVKIVNKDRNDFGRVIADTLPRPVPGDVLFDPSKAEVKWGLHTKTTVVRSREQNGREKACSLIGSHNFDQQSGDNNDEDMLEICSIAVAQETEDNIHERMTNADWIGVDGNYQDGSVPQFSMSPIERAKALISGPARNGRFPRDVWREIEDQYRY